MILETRLQPGVPTQKFILFLAVEVLRRDGLSLFYKTWCNSMCGIGPMAHPVLLPGATMVWSKSELSTNVGGATSPGKL